MIALFIAAWASCGVAARHLRLSWIERRAAARVLGPLWTAADRELAREQSSERLAAALCWALIATIVELLSVLEYLS